MDEITLIHGDCLEEMSKLKPNSIDTIITDPPYGIAFMGKVWDNSYPATEVWKEALRLIKPGGTLLCFGGTRTYHRLACAIEDAGWILKDCIMWLYGSGFPKATDISKQLDKSKGLKRTGIIKKDGSGSGRQLDTVYETGNPVSEEAKLWNGWKSHGLKPAYEPILVAMKPNEGSYAENALKHGVSGLNIDGGRIDSKAKKWNKPKGGIWNPSKDNNAKLENNPQGCFPANIILDKEAAKMLDEQNGKISYGSKNGGYTYNKKYKVDGFIKDCKPQAPSNYADKGGASRFFYVAKASKTERNMGCGELEEKQVNDGRKNQTSINCPQQRGITFRKNSHPTVKPLKLMEYLCRLTKTPIGGIVLDPFMGSGTTGMACKLTCRKFIGIEKEKEYYEIAKHRIANTQKNLL